jgi:hypothetical protein
VQSILVAGPRSETEIDAGLKRWGSWKQCSLLLCSYLFAEYLFRRIASESNDCFSCSTREEQSIFLHAVLAIGGFWDGFACHAKIEGAIFADYYLLFQETCLKHELSERLEMDDEVAECFFDLFMQSESPDQPSQSLGSDPIIHSGLVVARTRLGGRIANKLSDTRVHLVE